MGRNIVSLSGREIDLIKVVYQPAPAVRRGVKTRLTGHVVQEVRANACGPGRYDRSFEVEGLDYPLPYVRWTENRNLQAFLSLVASDDIDPGHLNTELRPFSDAVSAYEELEGIPAGVDYAALQRFEDLPAHARAYVSFIEERLDIPVVLISTGPQREALIRRREVFPA